MYLPQFKLSKLAAGIGSVLWFMAYAPQLQAQPRQIAPMIPLASTWPDYGRIARGQLETRALAAQDANDSAFVRAWRNSTHEGHAEGGPLSSNLPRNVSAATGRPLTDADIDAMVNACRGGSDCDCAYCTEQQREAHEQSMREFDASVARCKAAGCANAPDGPGPHYCATSTPSGFTHVPGVGDYPTAYVERHEAKFAEGGSEPFAVDHGTDPEAAPMTAEASVKYDRVRATRKPEPLTDAEHAELNEMLVELRAKPKRVRVRAKPLTAADIVIGGEYVPKRGNNKTPNLIVAAVSPDGSLIVWHRSNESPADCNSASTVAEFLALAARRVNA